MGDQLQTSEQLAENESVRRLSQRSLSLATASLAVVVLVMVLSFTLVVGLASSAQKDADNASVENAALRTELTCRSIVVNEHAIAQGRLQAKIAEGLILLSRAESLEQVAAELVDLTVVLEAAATEREQAVATCLVEPTNDE